MHGLGRILLKPWPLWHDEHAIQQIHIHGEFLMEHADNLPILPSDGTAGKPPC